MSASSPVDTLVEPSFCTLPAYDRTFGPEVVELNRLVGFGPDPEQERILDATFAVDRNGKAAAFEVAVICCRQNLKTGVKKQAALGWLFVTDERLVVWSAHEFRTSQEAFRDLDELITGSDMLRRRVKHIYRGNGDESIELMSGARLIFKTRTKGGGRGLSGNKVILDEGMFLQPMHMGALLPTLSAQPDPQVMYGSSAGLVESGVLRGIRDRGRVGDPRLAYFEWCAPPPADACAAGDSCTHALTVEGCGCDRPDLWRRANPAMGRRISAEYIAAERRAMPPEEFGRERMGWWDDPIGADSPITPDAWSRRADVDSRMVDPVAFAIDVAPDRSAAAIGVAGRRGDELLHVEVIDHRPGTGWLTDRIVELAGRWSPCVLTIDPAGPAGALLRELDAAGFKTEPGHEQWRLQIVGARETAQAQGAFVDLVVNDRLRHLNQAVLASAIEGARTRPLAEASAWSRKTSAADISPLVAVTLAAYGYATFGRDGDTSLPPPAIF